MQVKKEVVPAKKATPVVPAKKATPIVPPRELSKRTPSIPKKKPSEDASKALIVLEKRIRKPKQVEDYDSVTKAVST